MSALNKVMIIGNLGRDAEIRYTTNGTAVATINVATTEVWNDNGKKMEHTEWHRVVIWGKAAESLSPYLVKGKQVYVEGKLRTRKWQDKDGVDRYTTEIRSDRVNLLGKKEGGTGAPHPADVGESDATAQGAPAYDDDIPF